MQQQNERIIELEIPEDFICPLTKKIMVNPVMLIESGNTYEHEAILEWIKLNETDYLTGDTISSHAVAPNKGTKKRIDAFLEKNRKINTNIIHETYLPESLIQALLTALQNNDLNTFIETLNKDNRLLSQTLRDNKNILWLACERASLEILDILLTKFDDNIKNFPGIENNAEFSLFLNVSRRLGLAGAVRIAKALHWEQAEVKNLLVLSVESNDIENVNIALLLGAAVTNELFSQTYNDQAKTALFKVLIQAEPSFMLQEDNCGNDLIMRTIKDGRVELSLFLITELSNQINLNKLNENKESALHIAVQQKQLDVVKALLNYSHTNIDQSNNQQETALQMAYKNYDKDDFEILKLLIIKGTCVDDLLLKAIENHHLELIQFLLTEAQGYIDPNICLSTGQTVLMLVIQKKQLQTIQLLLSHPKINIDQVDQNGNTALHYAATYGDQEIIKLLMKQHASIKDKNKDKKTPVKIARENGYRDLANWMEAKYRSKKIKPFLKPLKDKIEFQEKLFFNKLGATVKFCGLVSI